MEWIQYKFHLVTRRSSSQQQRKGQKKKHNSTNLPQDNYEPAALYNHKQMQKQGFPRRGKKIKLLQRAKHHLEQSTTLSTHTQESWMQVTQAGVETTKTINTSVTKGKEKIAQTV